MQDEFYKKNPVWMPSQELELASGFGVQTPDHRRRAAISGGDAGRGKI
jgi:hypothetical protein